MKKVMGVVLAAVLVMPMICGIASAQDYAAKVKDGMGALQGELQALGQPRLEGNEIYFGDTLINDNYDQVDDIYDRFGCTATVFSKQGEDFVRVSTNVIKDGARAVGTKLDPAGPAMAAIKTGQAFYGQADILGAKFETGYEPIKDASGATIGIYYVGYKLS